MKIEYSEPSILQQIDQAITQAKQEGKRIECIRLNTRELEDFCAERGVAFNKECGYLYEGTAVRYDWGVL